MIKAENKKNVATKNWILVWFTLIFLFSSELFKTVTPCSPNPYKPHRDITELAILAPIVIVARVLNISVESNWQMLTDYSACLNVTEIIKSGHFISIPQTFCTKQFGSESLCLSHVFPNTSYVFFLDTDLQARYDAHFSAVRPANDIVIALSRKGYCDVKNSTNCVAPNITDAPKKLIIADEGSDVILACRASGTKPHVVTWLYKGSSVDMPYDSSVGYDGNLVLRRVSASVGGKYTCIVNNPAGSVSHETKIVVKLKYCGGVLMVNRKMDIVSPNFPGLYPPDKTCVWRLCPPRSYRIKFHFNVFQLHSTDSINIDNECNAFSDSWKRYCGSVSPGEFISRCRSKCVQLRLFSKFKFQSDSPFLGMNVTLEPTLKKRTKKSDVLKDYCDSDIVIKGRYISHNPWPFDSIKIFTLDSFKGAFLRNKTYDIILKRRDKHGCFQNYNFIKDHFYFATKNGGLLKLITAVADDNSREAVHVEKKLSKYRTKVSFCQPQ